MWRKYLTITLIFSPQSYLWLCSSDTCVLEMLIWVLIFFRTRRTIHSQLWCCCHTSHHQTTAVTLQLTEFLGFFQLHGLHLLLLGALHLNGTRRDLWSVVQQSDQNIQWNFINLYQCINLKSQILILHEVWGIWKLSMWWKLCFSPLHSRSQNHRIVGVGRDLCGSSSPTPLPKQGHLQ